MPSVAILSNQATDQQIRRIAALAHQFTDGVVALLYDLDEEGERGMDQDIVKFSQHCKVQRGWWRNMDARLNVNDPAELNAEQVDILREHVASRGLGYGHFSSRRKEVLNPVTLGQGSIRLVSIRQSESFSASLWD